MISDDGKPGKEGGGGGGGVGGYGLPFISICETERSCALL